MNLSETARALALVQAFDQRTVGDADVIAWQGVLADATLADVEEAVRQHYAEETGRIMPAHIRRAVRDMVSQREMARTATPWAPGQYGVLKADAMPEVTGPVDENALTPSVRALLDATRAMLPEGSREALMPRRVAWEKEFAAQERQKNAVPNPHYKPPKTQYVAAEEELADHSQAYTADFQTKLDRDHEALGGHGPHFRPMGQCPGGIMSWSDLNHGGVLRHQDGSLCGGHLVESPPEAKHECLIKDGRCLVKGHDDRHRCGDCSFVTVSAERLDWHLAATGHSEAA